MKGIKRDPSLFPTLKEEKFHNSWHRSFENQMHAQGLHQVIDPTYNPTTPDEQAVFSLMQTFTYAVLEAKVITTKGKEIVCQLLYGSIQNNDLPCTLFVTDMFKHSLTWLS